MTAAPPVLAPLPQPLSYEEFLRESEPYLRPPFNVGAEHGL
jgi:hypothetical protein